MGYINGVELEKIAQSIGNNAYARYLQGVLHELSGK
jgi:hypothetical protein